MKKRGILKALAGLALAAGCQKQTDSNALTVLNYADATSPSYAVEQEIWSLFEKLNPNINLERENSFNEAYHQKLQTYASSGKLPNVMYLWPGTRSGYLYEQRLIKDLTPFAAPYKGQFIDGMLEPQLNGILGEIPIAVTASHVFYINKALLNQFGLQTPRTYEELKALREPLRAVGKDLVLMSNQDDWVMQSALFSMIVGRMAGDSFVRAVAEGKAKFTDKPFVDSLAMVKRMYDDGVLNANSLQVSYGEVAGLFAAERAPFYIDGDWKIGSFITDKSTGKALIDPQRQQEIELSIFPALPGEVYSNVTSIVPGTGFGINANIASGSAKERAAWDLVIFQAGAEAQAMRMAAGGGFPSRKDVIAGDLEPISRQQSSLYPPHHKASLVLDSIFEPHVIAYINTGLQEIALGAATPEETAARIQQAFDSSI